MKSSSSEIAAASLKSGWLHLVCRYSPHEALWTHSPLYICWLWGQRGRQSWRESAVIKKETVVREVEENNTWDWNIKIGKRKEGQQIRKVNKRSQIMDCRRKGCHLVTFLYVAVSAPSCSTSVDQWRSDPGSDSEVIWRKQFERIFTWKRLL